MCRAGPATGGDLVTESDNLHSLPRFQALLGKRLSESLDDSEGQELDQLLNSSAECRELYVQQIWTDSLLKWELTESNTTSSEFLEIPLSVDADPVIKLSSTVKGNRFTRFWQACLVLLVFGTQAIYWITSDPTKDQQPPQQIAVTDTVEPHQVVAVLLDSEDVVWSDGRASVEYGTSFHKNEILKLESGLIRIAFDCGAGVVLEGPAELKLCSAWQACLHQGKLAAVVPEGAEGFTVLTPQKRIVDLGTKFGASVDESGQANVQVYEGEVKVESRNEVAASESLLLTAKEHSRYSENNSQTPEIKLQGVDSEDQISVPSFEQLAVARTGVYPPSEKTPHHQDSEYPIPNPETQAPMETFPASVILGEDFYPRSHLSPAFTGKPNALNLDSAFARVVFLQKPLQWQDLNGGHFALEMNGRNPAYPSIANRMHIKLESPIKEEVYFSFLGHYQGLDENDFFSLWFDNHFGEGTSHSMSPNAGIRFGEYFARMTVNEAGYFSVPADDIVFCLVGHLRKNQQGKFHAIDLWVNPQQISPSEPDIHVEFNDMRKQSFTVVGIRMGKDTEPDDRFLFDRLVIARSLQEVLESTGTIVPASPPPTSTFPQKVAE
ncbi:FecR protein [Rubinisphaera italica]|uniref:FecR protein n=1 Tax=Rubinisphaera italica TaxID=2527969 RepID=A0A5C5XDA2_9PLAN|nr:FecR protein [Rubinisphaera italica]